MTPPASELSGFAFAANPLDRADALRDDAEAIARLWPEGRVLVLDADGNAYTDATGALLPLTGAQLGGGPGAAIFLGLQDGRGWFGVEAAAVPLQAPGRMDLRRSASEWPAAVSSLFAYARGMSYWHSRTRYCGVCGGQIAFRRAGFIGHCPDCGNEHYPRVDPAIIAAVSDGPRLLLGRQPTWQPQRYSVIAGFVEPGESLEQTVAREVYEETRVRVRSCRYLAAQPWPFPGALMLGFAAVAHPDPPQVDGELEDARWFDRDAVGTALREDAADAAGIRLPPPLSIARSLIEHWYRHGAA